MPDSLPEGLPLFTRGRIMVDEVTVVRQLEEIIFRMALNPLCVHGPGMIIDIMAQVSKDK